MKCLLYINICVFNFCAGLPHENIFTVCISHIMIDERHVLYQPHALVVAMVYEESWKNGEAEVVSSVSAITPKDPCFKLRMDIYEQRGATLLTKLISRLHTY